MGMGKVLHFLWAFCKRLYTFLILLASDPFDISERWFTMNYEPPTWLFWLLLVISMSTAVLLAVRELRQKEKHLAIEKIPKILNAMSKHLKKKVKRTVKRVLDKGDLLELNGVLKKCMRAFGVTKELPKPKKLPVTERYRKSIHNKVSEEMIEQMYDKERSWELNMQVGGILDNEHYGLQIEDDTKYDKYEDEVNTITKNYIGVGSSDLTNQKNDYLLRMYASYSYLLFIGYWEILVDFAKYHGVDNIVAPEKVGFLSLKYKGVDKYLSEELEKVKACIAEIISKGKQNDEHE